MQQNNKEQQWLADMMNQHMYNATTYTVVSKVIEDVRDALKHMCLAEDAYVPYPFTFLDDIKAKYAKPVSNDTQQVNIAEELLKEIERRLPTDKEFHNSAIQLGYAWAMTAVQCLLNEIKAERCPDEG